MQKADLPVPGGRTTVSAAMDRSVPTRISKSVRRSLGPESDDDGVSHRREWNDFRAPSRSGVLDYNSNAKAALVASHGLQRRRKILTSGHLLGTVAVLNRCNSLNRKLHWNGAGEGNRTLVTIPPNKYSLLLSN